MASTLLSTDKIKTRHIVRDCQIKYVDSGLFLRLFADALEQPAELVLLHLRVNGRKGQTGNELSAGKEIKKSEYS